MSTKRKNRSSRAGVKTQSRSLAAAAGFERIDLDRLRATNQQMPSLLKAIDSCKNSAEMAGLFSTMNFQKMHPEDVFFLMEHSRAKAEYFLTPKNSRRDDTPKTTAGCDLAKTPRNMTFLESVAARLCGISYRLANLNENARDFICRAKAEPQNKGLMGTEDQPQPPGNIPSVMQQLDQIEQQVISLDEKSRIMGEFI